MARPDAHGRGHPVRAAQRQPSRRHRPCPPRMDGLLRLLLSRPQHRADRRAAAPGGGRPERGAPPPAPAHERSTAMSRIEPPKRPSPLIRLLLRLARRETAKLTGRQTERMIEPFEAYAHLPRLAMSYGMLEGATAKLDRLPERGKVLAEPKAATMATCEYCIDIGSTIARRAGVSEAQLLALPGYRESDEFDELEKLVLDYAVGMSRTPVEVSDELFASLREHFDDAQLVELTNVLALE